MAKNSCKQVRTKCYHCQLMNPFQRHKSEEILGLGSNWPRLHGYTLVISRDAAEMETFCSSNKSIGWKGTVGNRYNYITQSLLHLSLQKVVICLLLVLPLEESGMQFYGLAVLQVRTFFSISRLCHSRPINMHVFLCQFSLNSSSLLLLFPPVTRINPMM